MKILIAHGLLENQFLLPHIFNWAQNRAAIPDGILLIEEDECQSAISLAREDFLFALHASLRAKIMIMPNRTCHVTIENMVFMYVKESSIIALFGVLLEAQKLGRKTVLISTCTSHILYRLGVYFEFLAAVIIISPEYRRPKLIRIPILQSGSCAGRWLSCLDIIDQTVCRFIELPC